MGRDAVMRWVGEYERAWREDDVDGVERLFTEDARYRFSPYEESVIGHRGIREVWLQDQGRRFTFAAWPVAVEGNTAVVRVDVTYLDPRVQAYRDVWLLTFAGDGRVEDFEEWAYWPGKSSSAPGDSTAEA